jgi:hypothetical protein
MRARIMRDLSFVIDHVSSKDRVQDFWNEFTVLEVNSHNRDKADSAGFEPMDLATLNSRPLP